MATVDYGVDISANPDLDPMMPEVSGRALLVEAIYRRLITQRGSLFYDPSYGYALMDLLDEALNASDVFLIQSEVQTEALKDERIQDALCLVSYEAITETLKVTLILTDGLGPFSLVLAVSATSVEILTGPQTGLIR